jgi:predicted esterase YcpF (UPF0227 family)
MTPTIDSAQFGLACICQASCVEGAEAMRRSLEQDLEDLRASGGADLAEVFGQKADKVLEDRRAAQRLMDEIDKVRSEGGPDAEIKILREHLQKVNAVFFDVRNAPG